MIIKNSQQDIIIDESNDVKVIGLKISGGADSAIVGYMLCKYVTEERPDIKILPITTIHTGKPFQEIYSKRVVAFLKEQFGDIFLEHQTNQCDELGETYVTSQEQLLKSCYKNKQIGVGAHYTGITANPPLEITETFGHAGPDDDRNGKMFETHGIRWRKPLANIDKKGVAELYHSLGVFDTLFPITRSCEAWAKHEEYNIDKHCGTCWWCKERHWGFGKL